MRIVRRGTGSVVTWRRAQMVLLSAQGMDAAGIAKVAFTSEDGVRDVIRNVTPTGSASGKNAEPGREPRLRMRATYTRTEGVRHLPAAYELGEDKLFGHVKPRKTRGRFLEFCRCLRTLTRRPDRDHLG